jgi:hypothetical protein
MRELVSKQSKRRCRNSMQLHADIRTKQCIVAGTICITTFPKFSAGNSKQLRCAHTTTLLYLTHADSRYNSTTDVTDP